MVEWRKQENGNTCPMCRVVLTEPTKKQTLSHELMVRTQFIAHISVDAEEFLENLTNVMTVEELELILTVLGSR
jgi:hypothetical protein